MGNSFFLIDNMMFTFHSTCEYVPYFRQNKPSHDLSYDRHLSDWRVPIIILAGYLNLSKKSSKLYFSSGHGLFKLISPYFYSLNKKLYLLSSMTCQSYKKFFIYIRDINKCYLMSLYTWRIIMKGYWTNLLHHLFGKNTFFIIYK